MFKAYLIDAEAREVRAVDVESYKHMNRLLGCSCFTSAWTFPTDEVLYVDDEGLIRKPPCEYFFWLKERTDQPLAGNGMVLGPEGYDVDGNDVQHPPTFSIETLRAAIRFVSRGETVDWAKENPNAINVTETSSDGTTVFPIMPEAFPEAFEPPAP